MNKNTDEDIVLGSAEVSNNKSKYKDEHLFKTGEKSLTKSNRFGKTGKSSCLMYSLGSQNMLQEDGFNLFSHHK